MRELAAESSTITYSASISACEKGSQWPGALSLLAQVGVFAAVPDISTYNACINGCEKGPQWPGAPSLLA